jgi:hypothetical protein
MAVTDNDLLDTNWTSFKIIKSKVLENTYAIVLFCKDKPSCVHFMQLLLNNTYQLRLDKDKEGKYKFVVNFIQADKELFCKFDTDQSDFLNKLNSKAIKSITTGHITNDVPFLNDTMLPLTDDSFLLN